MQVVVVMMDMVDVIMDRPVIHDIAVLAKEVLVVVVHIATSCDSVRCTRAQSVLHCHLCLGFN